MAFLKRSMNTMAAAGALAAAALAAPAARAEAPPAGAARPFAYGILVGTNVGGAGQQPLRYAEDDARRVAQVLRELGRYGGTDLRVLVRPDGAQVLAAVDEVAPKLRAHQAKGEQAVLVFYYSGHAKANAFNLGAEELPVAALRDRLRQLPASVTLVVLDACQSGQFARAKGAAPAADFSANSVSRLTTKGVAVMASSSAQELSQESDELKSGYFTHHLVVGLRGAADADADGLVSLDEAYRYAYRRTLASTARTRVGGQHVTLDTDLAGQGDVPITYPAAAGAWLELPAALDARVLVQHKASGSVAAEVQKSPGAPVRLALAAGAYEALVRQAPDRVVSCRLALENGRAATLDPGACEAVALPGAAKGPGGDADGADGADAPAAAPWSVEAAAGPRWRNEGAFTRRLGEFGYEPGSGSLVFSRAPRWRAHLGVMKGVVPHVSVGAQVHTLGGDTYSRRVGESDDTFSWDTYGLAAVARAASSPVGGGPGVAHLELYGQLNAGLTLGVTKLSTGSQLGGPRQTTTETHRGFVLGGFGGAAIVAPRFVSFFAQAGYEYAPTVSNLLGDKHDDGGPSLQLGVSARFE